MATCSGVEELVATLCWDCKKSLIPVWLGLIECSGHDMGVVNVFCDWLCNVHATCSANPLVEGIMLGNLGVVSFSCLVPFAGILVKRIVPQILHHIQGRNWLIPTELPSYYCWHRHLQI